MQIDVVAARKRRLGHAALNDEAAFAVEGQGAKRATKRLRPATA